MPSQKQYGFDKKKNTLEVTLPSLAEDGTTHNVVLVRIPDPTAFIAMGLLDSMDSLSAVVGLKIGEIDASGKPSAKQAAEIKKLTEQKDALMAGLDMIDKVVEWMVVSPQVIRPVLRDLKGKPILDKEGKETPLGPDERDDALLYTDDVDLDDRMFLLNFAMGGTRDLETFREGHQKIVDAVAAVPELPLSAVKPVRRKG